MEKIYWSDRKHICGLPISFTKYSMDEDCLYVDTGIVTLRKDEVRLYRVRDISLVRTLADRIFGVGTIIVDSNDVNLKHLHVKCIKNPDKVRKLLSRLVEESRRKNRMRVGEFMGGPHGADDDYLDGDPDSFL